MRYRELETLLRTTLVSAERASQELKEQARREATIIVEEAHAEARKVRRDAFADARTHAHGVGAASVHALGAALATLDDGNGAERAPRSTDEAEAA